MHNEIPPHEKYKKLGLQNGPAEAAKGGAGSEDRSTTEASRTAYRRHRTSEAEETEDGKHSVQAKNKTVTDGIRGRLDRLCLTFQSSSSVVIMFVLTAVIGVLTTLFLHHSDGRSPQDVLQARNLLGSLEEHGYYGQHRHPVERSRTYGSPDLLTEDYKRELADMLSMRASVKRDQETEQDIWTKGGGRTNFLTIDFGGQRKREGGAEDQYVVVFDAGSTGSRVHVYQFHFEGDEGVEMVNEVYQYVKPGLSDFVHNPDEGAASIQPLLDVAMEAVPQSQHSSTPLVFKATAGLRLLDASGADNLLNKVQELFSSTDFSINPDDISIMGGVEEGLYGWVTVNYLLGNLDGNSQTAAVLDLGGGSVQVTYEPENLGDFSEDLAWVELFGNGYALYTQSYLGQGLKAARNGTLKDAGDGTLTSDCLPVGYSGTFRYGGSNYKIRGPDEPSLDGCWQQVEDFIESGHLSALLDLVGNSQNPDIYLFSYFFDILKWVGVINGETEKIVTVNDYYNAAHEACVVPDPKEPFMCQDLTFITRMLGETFMLWDKPLHVVSQMNSVETSWTLGAALDALSSLQSEE